VIGGHDVSDHSRQEQDQDAPVAIYKCLLLGQDGKVEVVDEIASFTKWGALRKVRAMLRNSPPQCTAFELWFGNKLITRSEGRTRHRAF